MKEWFEENFQLDIFQERFQPDGNSKAKTLRGFVEVAEPRLVARVLRRLWEYRCSLDEYHERDSSAEDRLKRWLDQFTAELDNASALKTDDVLWDFSEDTTLPKLRASIATDLEAGKPEVALDRMHTYCVKRIRALLGSRRADPGPATSLDGLFGAYAKLLSDEGSVSKFIKPILSVQTKIFAALNKARNERSFAHDNELLAAPEAKFMTECVIASLNLIECIEAARERGATGQADRR